MKNKFVADGATRLMRANQKKLAKSIEEKYSAEIAAASGGKKLRLRAKMMLEQLGAGEHLEKHQPSFGTLW